MKFVFLSVMLAPVLLSACVGDTPKRPVVPERPPAQACGADGLQGLVGQPARVLQTLKFEVQTRIIRPGMAVTMDYSENRLNIEIDERNRISRVACG